MDKIYEVLTEIFQDIFDDESIELKPETTAKDIEGWDSLANINIIVSIEDEFGVKFSVDDIQNAKCVGDMAAIIAERQA